jgi:hypothetical protein
MTTSIKLVLELKGVCGTRVDETLEINASSADKTLTLIHSKNNSVSCITLSEKQVDLLNDVFFWWLNEERT